VTLYRKEVLQPDNTVILEPATASTASQVTTVAVPTTADATQVLVDPVVDPDAEAKRRLIEERRRPMADARVKMVPHVERLPTPAEIADEARAIERQITPSATVRPPSGVQGLGIDPFEFRQNIDILAPPTN
jgi:hypothetical protein